MKDPSIALNDEYVQTETCFSDEPDDYIHAQDVTGDRVIVMSCKHQL